MQEVKAREEEYSSVKALAGQIRNLPPGFALARRDRRLLAHGLLRRIHLSSKGAAGIAPPSPPSPSNLSSRLMPLTSPDASRRTSAISDSASMDSWAPSTPKFRLRPKETPLHAFVFSDIILFATYQPEGGKSKKTATAGSGSYKLVDQIGLGRVLGVMDLSGRTGAFRCLGLNRAKINVGAQTTSTSSSSRSFRSQATNRSLTSLERALRQRHSTSLWHLAHRPSHPLPESKIARDGSALSSIRYTIPFAPSLRLKPRSSTNPHANHYAYHSLLLFRRRSPISLRLPRRRSHKRVNDGPSLRLWPLVCHSLDHLLNNFRNGSHLLNRRMNRVKGKNEDGGMVDSRPSGGKSYRSLLRRRVR